MNTEIQKIKKTSPKKTNSKSKKTGINKIIKVSVLTLIILTAMFAGFSLYSVLNYDRIYNGVFVSSFNAGGLTRDELTKSLNTNYSKSIIDKQLILKYKDKVEKISVNDIDFKYQIDKAVEEAYDIARSGNIFKRVYDVFKVGKDKKVIEMSYTYNKDELEKAIEDLNKTVSNPVKNHEIKFSDDKVILKTGHIGDAIDKTATYKLLEELLKKAVFKTIDVPSIKTNPEKIDVEKVYNEISKKPQNAQFVAEGKTYKIKPEIMGRSIDKSVLASIINEIQESYNTEKVLPVIFSKPDITANDIQNNLFKDTLSTFSTRFSTGNTNDANRGVNIRLAASKINGKILAPGEVFSFNDTVGERTKEGGYKEAHTYVAGKIVDGIGGGICQVSTTLYNAVLMSDLDVVRRSNHQFTVSYVPFGRDAAVSYPDLDLKFRNSTKWPLKIVCYVTNSNNINFSLIGKNDTPTKQVILNTKTVKTIEPTVKNINDPTMNVGTTSVVKSGGRGYVIDTYKIVKVDNKVIKDSKIHTSYYRPLTREVKVGTKKPSSGTTSSPVATKKPSTNIQNVDDVDNPQP
ncbi:VanW family protein [Pseudobacteroides cellulosolvens]|uniref:VanW family protein n=1 Tax=Pseudobacteroides cellulosolvens ATCC 35603 = DSM 2933 TaxID=398512 RepID=A0A0L6JV85_9FIRM|nr:VanW family protein [Pseudobacteroides cellulosolvens]KNY29756.1 VanW family protein [Pseudobacteroides cellulosolvens ATCC 35603 = DSM 2933]